MENVYLPAGGQVVSKIIYVPKVITLWVITFGSEMKQLPS